MFNPFKFLFSRGIVSNNKIDEIEQQNQIHNIEEDDKLSINKLNNLAISKNANNDLVSSVRKAFENGTIGTEIPIQMRTKDSQFNNDFEKWLKIWSLKGNCEVSGRFYRGLAERSLIGYALVQGGFIIRHHYNEKWLIPYKFEIIPLHMIDRRETITLNGYINGIKINSYGEIQSILIYTDNNKEISEPVSYKDLTLYLNPFLDPTQYTGLSELAPILATLDMLEQYSQAELSSAKERADTPLIIKTHLYAELLEILKQKAKQNGKNLTNKELSELYKKFKINGTIKGANYIPSDDEVVQMSKAKDTVFQALDNTSKRTISSGVGLSSQSTFREMPSSYNAALLNNQKDDREYAIALKNFTELVWREVIAKRLLESLILSGKVKANDYWELPYFYHISLEFQRASTAHIDPAKNETANAKALENGVKNKVDIISQQGGDYEENIRKEIQYEISKKKIQEEMYKQNGLKVPKEENEK